jgi:hypothetical protein
MEVLWGLANPDDRPESSLDEADIKAKTKESQALHELLTALGSYWTSAVANDVRVAHDLRPLFCTYAQCLFDARAELGLASKETLPLYETRLGELLQGVLDQLLPPSSELLPASIGLTATETTEDELIRSHVIRLDETLTSFNAYHCRTSLRERLEDGWEQVFFNMEGAPQGEWEQAIAVTYQAVGRPTFDLPFPVSRHPFQLALRLPESWHFLAAAMRALLVMRMPYWHMRCLENCAGQAPGDLAQSSGELRVESAYDYVDRRIQELGTTWPQMANALRVCERSIYTFKNHLKDGWLHSKYHVNLAKFLNTTREEIESRIKPFPPPKS